MDEAVTVHLLKTQQRLPVGYLLFRNKQQMRPVIQAGRAYARHYLAGQIPSKRTAGVGANPDE